MVGNPVPVRTQLISCSLLCRWFSDAVLPLYSELFAEFYAPEEKRRCTVCGAPFASKSNNAKYCPDCRKKITRKQAAERMQKREALLRNRGWKCSIYACFLGEFQLAAEIHTYILKNEV